VTAPLENSEMILEYMNTTLFQSEAEKSIICLTCGLLYCEKCGKLLVTTHDKNYMQHNSYN